MKTEILLTSPVKKLFPDQIQETIFSCSEKVKGTFPLDIIDVVALIGKSDIGIHGNSFYKDTIMIIIDRNYNGDNLIMKLSSTYYHELHHLARMATVGYGETLEEAIITEGLGVAMEEEMLDQVEGYYQLSNRKELSIILKEFAKEKKSKEYDHERWFFGDENIPKLAGYKLGYLIVKGYLQDTGKKASELFSVTANEVISQSKLMEESSE